MAQFKNEKASKDFVPKSNIVHNYKYDYKLIDYVNSYTPVKIICSIHGIFEQIPANHLSGHGCPKCIGVISKQEIEIYNYIKDNLNIECIQSNRKIIRPYELDIVIPSLKLAFEFNGSYWH